MRPFTYLPNYTVEDYRLWQGNWELIDGIAHSMSPSPVRRHQRLATLLAFHLETSFRKINDNCGSCGVEQELDWIVNDSNVLRPDIVITCDKTGDFITTSPILIIEILSPSTAIKDVHVKFGIYEEQKVKYYIIVRPDTKTYTIYVLGDNGYTEKNNLKSFSIHDACTIDLDVDKALSELGDE